MDEEIAKIHKKQDEILERLFRNKIHRAVSTAIRDTKLQIARELYDEARSVHEDTLVNPYEGYPFGRVDALESFANRLALEALGLQGL